MKPIPNRIKESIKQFVFEYAMSSGDIPLPKEIILGQWKYNWPDGAPAEERLLVTYKTDKDTTVTLALKRMKDGWEREYMNEDW